MSTATYLLKGHGDIDMSWLRECFALFKTRGVTIRRLLLLQQPHASATAGFSTMEIQFVVRPETDGAFLQDLETCLAHLRCPHKSLEPVTF